jgi:uncharacterized protein
LRDQLELLFILQTIDDSIRNSQELQKKYNSEIAKAEKELNKEQEQYEKGQNHFDDIEKEHKNNERMLTALEDQKKKIEDKLLLIKTNKEYQAALQEIESSKGLIKEKEDEIIESLDKIDSTKVSARQLEENLNKSRERFEERKKQIEEDIKSHIEKTESQKEKREKVVQKLDVTVLDNYIKIQNVRQGFAVAIAKDEKCMGCSMKIPPQIYNEVVFGEKIKTCPYCNRILYVESDDTNKEK